jgi:TBC1 domain family member 2
MARPPPARPHMAVHSSTYLSSFSSDWGEDDAWDSASDSESAAQRPTASASKSRSVSSSRVPPSSTAPRPVPPRPSNSSSSTLASSYTHLHAPSPSSYPPHSSAMDDGSPRGADWHIVSKTQDLRGAGEGWTGGAGESPEQLVAGEPDEEPRPSTSRRLDQGSVRHDVEAVVNGT